MEAVIARLAFLALAFALALPAAAQHFEITQLASFDTPLPTRGEPMPAAWMPRMNASGQMGFYAAFGSWDEVAGRYESYGVYRRTGTTTELLAFTGDPLPDGSGRSFDLVAFMAIESSGDVIILGESCGSLPPDSLDCFYGIYRATGDSLVTLVQSGQSVPDSATDTVGRIYYDHVAAADGHIAFVTTRNPSGLDVVYRWSAGALTPIASQGEPAPGTGRTFTAFRYVVVNSSGTVAFIGHLGTDYSHSGVFASENGALRTLASTGSPAPSGGSFDIHRSIALDEGGNVAFEAWTTVYAGIYVDSGGSLRTVALNGQTIAGTGAMLENATRPSIHDGRVVFWGDYHRGPPYDLVYGVFAEVDGAIARVAFQGQPAPDGLPGMVLDVGPPAVTPSGEILFIAEYGDSIDRAAGLFRARHAPGVPALGAPAWLLAALLLCAIGAVSASRARHAQLSFVALLAALTPPASAQQFEITPLLLSGIPIPLPPPSPPTTVWMDGPRSWMLDHGANAIGQIGFGVGFDAPADEEPLDNYESYGVYRRTGTTIEIFAFSGDLVPDGSGRSFDRVDFVAIENSGDVIVQGRSCDGVPLGSPDCLYGVYRATGSGLSTIVQTGQSVPDSATDTLGQILSVAVADGRIAFVTRREPSQLHAVYSWNAGTLTRIALEGEPAPEAAQAFWRFGWLDVNSSGTVSFIGYLNLTYSNSGAFVSEEGELRTLGYPGSPAPGGGTFHHLRSTGVDEAGNVVIDAWTTSVQPPYVGLCCDHVILVDSSGTLRTVARSGQMIPGTQVPFNFVRSPAIHEGRVAFYGDARSGATGPIILRAIFAEIDDGSIARVVYDGQRTPQGLPGDFRSIGMPRFSGGGEVVFAAAHGDPLDPASGIFRARFAPGVPALGAPAWALAAALLALSGARAARRASGRSARSAPRRARAASGGAGRRGGA